jgi:hypothetical protein
MTSDNGATAPNTYTIPAAYTRAWEAGYTTHEGVKGLHEGRFYWAYTNPQSPGATAQASRHAWLSEIEALLDVCRRLDKQAHHAQPAMRLALGFAQALSTTLSTSALTEAVHKNRTPAYAQACASHDYCDANMVMEQAFITVFERPFLYEGEPFDEDTLVWNSAWNIARRAEFSVALLQSYGDDEVLDVAVHAAFDAACAVIQAHLGVTSGDFAGAYFAGEGKQELRACLQGYLDAERRNATED